MITGWEDPRLMQAYDLIYNVMQSYPATLSGAVARDVMDSIEHLDDLIKEPADV